MQNKGYGILDFEPIWNMARDLIFNVLEEGMMLDEECNFVGCPENSVDWIEYRKTNSRIKYLDFRECEELHSITFFEATKLFTNDIREKYLSETLPFIRTIMRKGSLTPYQYVSDEVPDEYLDQIICTAWKSDLIIWAQSWDRHRRENEGSASKA